MTYHLQAFIRSVETILESHRLPQTGAYRRWNLKEAASSPDHTLNPYGCADAANILYTINRFPSDPRERAAWISVLRGLQSEKDGMFHESTHHEIHTTAHCIAALELFDALPAHSLAQLAPYRDPAAIGDFLEDLDWKNGPWAMSHRGAGIYAALVLSHEVTAEWKDAYFQWLFVNTDPRTGLIRKGHIAPITTPFGESIFPHLAGTFHYLFNQESDRRPHAHPAALVDTCLDLLTHRTFPLGNRISFSEIDWTYCLTRAFRQSGHRAVEVKSALEVFASEYIPFLLSLDPESHDGLDDLHSLFGALCCLAELQAALPGQIKTDRPLRLVLDRRPFI